jgi:hypothetical protein
LGILAQWQNLRNGRKPILSYLLKKFTINRNPTAEWLGVDAHWLRFGERLTIAVNERPAQWNSKLAPEEREAIEAFLALPPDKRKLFGQLMKACGK